MKLLADLAREDPTCKYAVAELLREVVPWSVAVLVPPNWDRRCTECFGFTLEQIGAEGAASLETKLRSAGLPMEELPGPPIFSPGMSAEQRSEFAMRLVWAGILGEKTGPPKRDPETMAALFRMVEGGMATDKAPPGTLQWDFPDAPATLRLRYEDWVDLVAGRLDPRKFALRGRLRPSGDLRWLWRARLMFPG